MPALESRGSERLREPTERDSPAESMSQEFPIAPAARQIGLDLFGLGLLGLVSPHLWARQVPAN